ncbi:MAG: hypothetical protein ACLFS3_01225 [Candidatus Aenigmatarchaeota archaeon]
MEDSEYNDPRDFARKQELTNLSSVDMINDYFDNFERFPNGDKEREIREKVNRDLRRNYGDSIMGVTERSFRNMQFLYLLMKEEKEDYEKRKERFKELAKEELGEGCEPGKIKEKSVELKF